MPSRNRQMQAARLPDPLLIQFVRALAKADARQDCKFAAECEEKCEINAVPLSMQDTRQTFRANDQLTIRWRYAGSSQKNRA